jgi:beta-phosphoglucomutase-like phosphatase (HAD superfamily)
MPLPSLTITITEPRIIDGWVEAANRNGITPEAIAGEFLAQQGTSYANLFGIGIITSAAFMARFTPEEYGTIMSAVQEVPEIGALVEQLTALPTVALDDPRVAAGLEQLVAAELLDEARVPELLAHVRPEPALGE